MTHELINEYQDNEKTIQKTTNPHVSYDVLTEVFIVDLADGAWCEVFGMGRFKHAVRIADLFRGEG